MPTIEVDSSALAELVARVGSKIRSGEVPVENGTALLEHIDALSDRCAEAKIETGPDGQRVCRVRPSADLAALADMLGFGE